MTGTTLSFVRLTALQRTLDIVVGELDTIGELDNWDDITIRRSYDSGMGAPVGFGIEADDSATAVLFIAVATEALGLKTALGLARVMKIDDMGLGKIIYFPGVTLI